jgi:Fur family transcriptional regulator, ferric uptake regulator
MNDFLSQASQVLAIDGGRMTQPRRIILEVISSSQEHLTADQILDRSRQSDRRINLSTVYRTLAFLKAHQLIEPRYFDQDNHREVFEPAPKAEHYHFTCTHCGQVIEFQSRHVPALRRQLHDEFGAEVSHACVCLTGLCPTCREARSK